MANRKKILIVSEAHLIKNFVQTTINKLKDETGTHFDCFIATQIDSKTYASLKEVFTHVYVNEYPKGILKNIPKIRFFQAIYGLRKLAKSLGNYDIIHIHFHHYYFSYFTPIIRNKAKKIFLTFFGSDFNQVGHLRHWHNQKTVNLLDGIFATSEAFLKKIILRYNISADIIQAGVLIPLMDNFVSFESFLKNNTNSSAKKIWQLEKKVIACGYNAAPIMQHKIIIGALVALKNKLSGYKMIFPMTYGWRSRKTRAMVRERLKKSLFDSLVLEDYLTMQKLQALRLASDIFINIPSRDQLASSMMEHLAAGSVVITGKWLPYDDLVEMGVYFIEIETPDDLSKVLTDVLDNLEKHRDKSKINREIILNMMSWDSIKTNWYKYYQLEQNT